MLFSCVANMVLLPTPLKAFTDSMVEVKAMLRICARNLYGWHCDRDDLKAAVALIDAWHEWDAYPASWPRAPGTVQPLGVSRLNDTIRTYAARRLDKIRQDLAGAGTHYPRAEVCAALAYWNIAV